MRAWPNIALACDHVKGFITEDLEDHGAPRSVVWRHGRCEPRGSVVLRVLRDRSFGAAIAGHRPWRLGAVVKWGRGVEGQLDQLDEGYRNLSFAVGANDSGPFQRSTLQSCLGILMDRGGARPIDGNAAGNFRRPIP